MPNPPSQGYGAAGRSTPKLELAGPDSAFLGDTMREMEAADWASLSHEELLERRISKPSAERLKTF
jgi:hypothetical protein